MGSYSLEIKKSAARELGDLPAKDCARIVARIQRLATDPRPRASEKLSGEEKHRLRQGDYRILYEIDDRARTVTVVKIPPPGSVSVAGACPGSFTRPRDLPRE